MAQAWHPLGFLPDLSDFYSSSENRTFQSHEHSYHHNQLLEAILKSFCNAQQHNGMDGVFSNLDPRRKW